MTRTHFKCIACGKLFGTEQGARGHANRTNHGRWELIDVEIEGTEAPPAPVRDPMDDAIDSAMEEAELARPCTPDTHPCKCGCGQGARSNFVPGHDGRMKGFIVRNVKAGKSWDDSLPEIARDYVRCHWAGYFIEKFNIDVQ